MRLPAHKIGAALYILWGLLHIVGAGVLLVQLSEGGGRSALATMGSAISSAELPQATGPLIDAILTYHSWNLLWIGIFVLVIGGLLNMQNSRAGYWLNLGVVSAVDGGLILLVVGPGYMALSDGLIGVVLWLPAVVFSTLGLWQRPRRDDDLHTPAYSHNSSM